jgi:peptidoglycan/xylan/chitin deacetylase (PgdA/CDA1 family)
VTVPGVAAPFGLLLRGRAVIFMLHRFDDQEMQIEGHSTAALRRGLEYLRRKRYDLVSLAEMYQRLAGNGRPLDRAVAFTMDDGYIDQATVAGPLFAEYDCPVTTFVTTGFLDRQLWFWWDRIEYVFEHTTRRQLQIRLGSEPLSYQWNGAAERTQARLDFIERCKLVPDGEKVATIERLAVDAGVALPNDAPARYAPMSWDQARQCEKRGMTFGPHTVTHPILARTEPDDLRRQIVESWTRLRAEVRDPVPVFCYPNGRWQDFGSREIAVLKSAGLAGAIVGESGYADVGPFRKDPDGPFRVQRFSYPEELADVIQAVNGIERFKQILRRES